MDECSINPIKYLRYITEQIQGQFISTDLSNARQIYLEKLADQVQRAIEKGDIDTEIYQSPDFIYDLEELAQNAARQEIAPDGKYQNRMQAWHDVFGVIRIFNDLDPETDLNTSLLEDDILSIIE